jgi:hypothetical protein
VFPSATVTAWSFRLTPVNTGAWADEIVIAAEEPKVIPFSEAFTNMATAPAVFLAVKVTALAVDELRVPIDGAVTLHE